MKTGFEDPIAPKSGKNKKSPWDYRQPPYDERSSCFVNAGTHQGIGFLNPVGHEGNPKTRVSTLPFGRVTTMETSYSPPKQLEQEYLE